MFVTFCIFIIFDYSLRIIFIYLSFCIFRKKVEPTVTAMLHGTPFEAHMFIERIDIKEVPDDEEGAAQWLRELYNKKVIDCYILSFT